MENKEFQFKGMTMNGFAMLFVNIMLTVLSAAIIVTGFIQNLNDTLTGLIVGFGFAVFAVTLFIWAGFVMLEPGEARVMMFFGNTKARTPRWATHGCTPSSTPRSCLFVPATLTQNLSR